jgi:hypothetical protein
MGLPYTITTTVATTAVSEGLTCIFHGTCEESALSLLQYGVDAEQAKSWGSGEAMWFTKHVWEAEKYARMPPYDRGPPVIVKGEIADQSLELFLRQPEPLWVVEHSDGRLEWFPVAYTALNSSIQNVTLTILQ